MTRKPSSAGDPAWRTRYGRQHPEKVENPLWQRAIAGRLAGEQVRQETGIDGRDRHRHHFAHSSYRDTVPGPFWSWRRFGRTSTRLPDGRIIHVAGEHEDGYDPDFCIYNDVVVEHPDGHRDIYLYPGDVFPPTDFHSATLLGDGILLIGSLGYHDLRRPGETQVLKLDTNSLRISRVETRGEAPGWISRHSVERLDDNRLLIFGGSLQTADDYGPNPSMQELDLATMTWSPRSHGDTNIFPISAEDYRTHKNPRFGTRDPERSDNPFWIEMTRRQWPARRARLHYGDQAPPEGTIEFSGEVLEGEGADAPYGTREAAEWVARLQADVDRSRLPRTRRDIVWTAVRQDAIDVELADGRRLLIGGEVRDYGDDYADPWVYNDVIVTHPDGRIEIWTYPPDVFPPLHWPAGVLHGDGVFIFGRVEMQPHEFVETVVRLDTQTMIIEPMPEARPPESVVINASGMTHDGNRVIFSTVHWSRERIPLGVAFDLEMRIWSEPITYTPPQHEDDDDDDDL